MNDIESIPLSSFLAYLLLEKRVVTFAEVSALTTVVLGNSISDIDIYDDEIEPLSNYIDIICDEVKEFRIKKGMDYNSSVNGISFRDYLLGLSSVLNKFDLSSINLIEEKKVNVKKKRLFFPRGKKN